MCWARPFKARSFMPCWSWRLLQRWSAAWALGAISDLRLERKLREIRKFLTFECNTECDRLPHGIDVRILAKITADGVFVEELEHNPEPWRSQQKSSQMNLSTESTWPTWAVCTDPKVTCEAKAQYLPSGPVEGLSDEASGSFCHDRSRWKDRRIWIVPTIEWLNDYLNYLYMSCLCLVYQVCHMLRLGPKMWWIMADHGSSHSVEWIWQVVSISLQQPMKDILGVLTKCGNCKGWNWKSLNIYLCLSSGA